jgi:hypothetical protein
MKHEQIIQLKLNILAIKCFSSSIYLNHSHQVWLKFSKIFRALMSERTAKIKNTFQYNVPFTWTMTISPTYYTYYNLSTPVITSEGTDVEADPFFWLELISTYTHQLFEPNPICSACWTTVKMTFHSKAPWRPLFGVCSGYVILNKPQASCNTKIINNKFWVKQECRSASGTQYLRLQRRDLLTEIHFDSNLSQLLQTDVNM